MKIVFYFYYAEVIMNRDGINHYYVDVIFYVEIIVDVTLFYPPFM